MLFNVWLVLLNVPSELYQFSVGFYVKCAIRNTSLDNGTGMYRNCGHVVVMCRPRYDHIIFGPVSNNLLNYDCQFNISSNGVNFWTSQLASVSKGRLTICHMTHLAYAVVPDRNDYF